LPGLLIPPPPGVARNTAHDVPIVGVNVQETDGQAVRGGHADCAER
jgi:hypothetical protein